MSIIPCLEANVRELAAQFPGDFPNTAAPDSWIIDASAQCEAKLGALAENVKLGSETAARCLLLVAARFIGSLERLYAAPTPALRKYIAGMLTLPIGDSLDPDRRAANAKLIEELGLGSRLALKKALEGSHAARRLAGRLFLALHEDRAAARAAVASCPAEHRPRLFEGFPIWLRDAIDLPDLTSVQVKQRADEAAVGAWFSVAWEKLIDETKGEPEKHAQLMALGKAGFRKYKGGDPKRHLGTDRANLRDRVKDKLARAFFRLFDCKFTRAE